MEPRIVLFLGFTSVALALNTLIVWFAYKMFASTSAKVTGGLIEFSSSPTTREWIKSVEVASHQAAQITSFVQQQISNFDPLLAHVQDVYGYGLAKMDTKCEAICGQAVKQAKRAQIAVLGPAEKIGMLASGVNTLLGFTNWTARRRNG